MKGARWRLFLLVAAGKRVQRKVGAWRFHSALSTSVKKTCKVKRTIRTLTLDPHAAPVVLALAGYGFVFALSFNPSLHPAHGRLSISSRHAGVSDPGDRPPSLRLWPSGGEPPFEAI
jgi:hypothetical protein